jgi:hypothetical protein
MAVKAEAEVSNQRALVRVAPLSALTPAGAKRLPLPTRLVVSIFVGSLPCL